MREIKFRGWHNTGKLMLEPIDLSQNPDYWKWKLHGDITLMQFTGLHDKHGKEIYEGDVVLIPDEIVADSIGGFNRYEPENHLSEVRFSNGAFGVETTKVTENLGRGFYSFSRLASELDITDMEVIGNLYENPELLKP